MGKNRAIKYRRILLKISGEAIEGQGSPFHLERIEGIAGEIGELVRIGVQVGIVIGGGNILRGEELEGHGLSRNQTDYMGMLATIINGLLFEDVLHSKGIPAALQSALVVGSVTEDIFLKRTLEYLSRGYVMIFTGGTGSPHFTTDTAAALRALEIGADILMKATKVDGVFEKDPALHPGARFYQSLSYDDVLNRQLKVMDMAAVSMCRDRRLPIAVFNIYEQGNIMRVVKGDAIGTIIKG